MKFLTKKSVTAIAATSFALLVGFGGDAEASANPSNSNSASVSVAEYGNRTIKLGTKGSDVREIQEDLKTLNYYTASRVDGIYGPISKRAVIQFQKSQNIKTDGIVGPQTKARLASAINNVGGSTNTKQPTTVQTQQTTKPVQTAPKQAVSTNSAIGSELANYALRFVGTPYKWGGTTPSGFDCSGFITYVLKQNGYTGYPRTSVQFYSYGKSVASPSVGDFVFFENTYKPGISHMGIYIGDGKFVHASSSGVKVDSLSNSYYKSRYAGARSVN